MGQIDAPAWVPGMRETSGDRRDAPRFNIYLPVMLRAAGDGGAPWHRAQTINVSRSGACLFSTRPWTMHQVLDMCLPGAGGGAAGSRFVSAWVVRVDALPRDGWGERGSYAIGVQFDAEIDIGPSAGREGAEGRFARGAD